MTINAPRLRIKALTFAATHRARSENFAAAHYYLAMNLGQLARTKSVGALKLVKQMEVSSNGID